MVAARDLWRSFFSILDGRAPALSIEITRECPLRCPGCYAFAPDHVAPGIPLKQLSDHRGDALVNGVLNLVRRLRPLHLSIVGGDPLVRYRELEVLVPQLLAMGIHLQIVTSAFRPLPAAWAAAPGLQVVVSVDGLQPDHDRRRAPATYARIAENIRGQHITVHCTLTAAMTAQPAYLETFLRDWSARPEVERIWCSIFTPQRGEECAEIPNPEQRRWLIAELYRLRELYPKLEMPRGMIAQFEHPPASPQECIFAQTTTIYSADLEHTISPCQFGGDPDCARCGCVASMGLAAVGAHALPGGLKIGQIMHGALAVGRWRSRRAQARSLASASAAGTS